MCSLNCTQQILKYELICAGQTLPFYDSAFNGTSTSRYWEFEGGSPSTSTALNPVITYNTPGSFDVKYTVSNAQGSDTKTWVDYVKVLSTTADVSKYAFYDFFEYATSAYENGKWINVNQYGQTNGWFQATNTSYGGFKCMVMKNEGNIRSEIDALITPSIDMTALNGTNKVMHFWYAYALRSANYQDESGLKIFVSTNCGEFWFQQPITTQNKTRSVLTDSLKKH